MWFSDGQTKPSLLSIVDGLFVRLTVNGQTKVAPAAGQTLRGLGWGNMDRGRPWT